MKKARSVGLLGALTALALACGSSEEKKEAAPATPGMPPTAAAPPAAGNAPVRHLTPEQMERRKAVNAGAKLTQNALPEGFPQDVPIYPEAQPKSSMMVGGDGLVVLTSNAPVADVVALYREQLPAQGWTVDSVKEAQGGARVSVRSHKGLRNTTVSVNQAKTGGGSEIGIAFRGE